MSPKFSTDGTKLAFGFWGGTALSKSPSGTLASDPTGSTLAVVDFTCNAGCTAGWAVSNARALTSPTNVALYVPLAGGATYHVTSGSKTVTATGSTFTNDLQAGQGIVFSAQAGVLYTVASVASDTSLTLTANYAGSTSTTSSASTSPNFAWPSFFPDGSAVVYQRQIVGSSAYLVRTAPSNINTRDGAQADLWISNVPATSATAATSTRLNALNGLSAGGVSYLPTSSRTVAPPTAFHSGHLTIPFTVADVCTIHGTALDVSDYQLNYLPAMNPTQAGGFNWVVFTTRRMYGSIAYDNPWDGNPGLSCNSGVPLTKKLWIAAIDGTYTPGTDPSHPAFYLPGQELAAGNSNGEWVNTPCASIGGSCTIADDCCGGTGGLPPRRRARLRRRLSRGLASRSVALASRRVVSATRLDRRATVATGSRAPARVESASIPSSSRTRSRRTHASSSPAAPRLGRARFGDSFSGSPRCRAAPPSSSRRRPRSSRRTRTRLRRRSGSGRPARRRRARRGVRAQTVDAVLVAAGLASKPYLLVTMVFNPDAMAVSTPTLKAWQQNYDCVAAQ